MEQLTRTKYHLYRFGLALVTLSLTLSALRAWSDPSTLWPERLSLSLETLIVVLLTLYCVQLKRVTKTFERLGYPLVLVVFLSQFVRNLERGLRLAAPGPLAEGVVWAPILLIATYLLFMDRHPLRHALLSFGAMLVVATVPVTRALLSGVLLPWGALLDVVLASLVAIGLLHFFAQVARTLAETRVHAELQAQLAMTDPLTGLPNRRDLHGRLTRELSHSERHGLPVSVIVFDIDRFKRVNDTLGHGVGDIVLQEVAGRVAQALRGEDQVGRWGGEEFLVVAPHTQATDAWVVAERLRHALAADPIPPAGVVTASFGTATRRPGEALESLLERADQALRAAKNAGRNQTQMAEGEAPPALWDHAPDTPLTVMSTPRQSTNR